MMNNIKKQIKKSHIYKTIYEYKWREHSVCYGNDNKFYTFYIIRRHANRAGLFSFVITNLGAIKLALDNGFVPVIDMKSSPNPMLSINDVGKINAWDLFFEQPCNFSLEDISKSKNIILGSINPPDIYPDYPILSASEQLLYWHSLAQKYIRPKKEILDERDSYIQKHLSGKRVLGVLCRGTDYILSKPSGHPIQPDISQVINDVSRIIEDYDINLIYLATEDANIWDAFNSAFPSNVISYQSNRFNLSQGENINDVAGKALSTYERNREYLISILVLSKCNILLAGATSGSIGALLMSDGYEYYHIYQLGVYE